MTTHVRGDSAPEFAELRALLEDNLDAGREVGVSVAVRLAGRPVADLWGGCADESHGRPWTEDTIVNVWSSTKMVTSLAVLMLVDRGQLDVDAPVARYWPEFAAAGKGNVLVRHVLSHTSGVSGWEQPFQTSDFYDLAGATARLAAQAPWWEPGTASGYHANNYGHLLGELVRRVTGASLTDFVRSEIAEPLSADFQIGLRAADQDRAAEVVPPPPPEFGEIDPQSIMIRTFTAPLFPAVEANSTAWRRAELGAVNGHGNARSLCTILSSLANGGVVGEHRLLRPETIDLIFNEQARGVDLVLGIPMRWGMGYALPEPASVRYIPDGRICFWGGYGGSMTIVDLDRALTISYVMNKMAPGIIGSERSAEYVSAIYKAIG